MPIILVVDEGTESREMLAGIFGSLEAELVFADSARAAIERFAVGDVDVVVSDMVLSQIDGLGLTRKLRRIDADAEVILLTAFERNGDLRRAIQLHLAGLFVKPFAASDLNDSIRAAVRRRSRLRPSGPGEGAPVAARPAVDEGAWVLREQTLAERENELEKQQEMLSIREVGLLERDGELEQREREIDQREQACEARLAQTGKGDGSTASNPADGGMEATSDEALRERIALLEEREAFLEASENALLERSQQLQELETELEHRAESMGGDGGGAASAEEFAALKQREAELEAQIAAQERELARRLTEIEGRERRVARDESLSRAREQYLRKSESILFSRDD